MSPVPGATKGSKAPGTGCSSRLRTPSTSYCSTFWLSDQLTFAICLIGSLLDLHHDPGDHQIGPGLECGGQDRVDVIVQKAMPEVLRGDNRDEHHDLIITTFARIVDEP